MQSRGRTLYTLSVAIVLALVSCESKEKSATKGIQEPYVAYVPARMAVLPCREWPNTARFANLPLNSADQKLKSEICEKFDEFVVNGFKEQPFMRGYSPKAIEKLLEKADARDDLKQLDSKWAKKPKDCIKCTTEGAYYTYSIQDRPEWRVWISELSKKTRNVDALLIPFFVFAAESVHDDRGLYIYERAVRLAMLLVDTSTGGLIWYNYRVGRSSNQKLVERSNKESLSPPAWTDAIDRTLVEDFWDEFPGRQYY